MKQRLKLAGILLFLALASPSLTIVARELFVAQTWEGKGFIDENGKFVIPPRNWLPGEFSEGLSCTENINGKYGYIDETGKFVIGPRYDLAGWFHDGLAVVVLGGHHSMINRQGETILDLNGFAYVGEFSEGLAVVQRSEKYGFIDKTGRVAIEPTFDKAYEFTEGLARVLVKDRWGFVDHHGLMVIKPQFEFAGSFCNSLARAQEKEKWGMIDKNGKWAIRPKFQNVEEFSDGLAPAKVNGKWGYINTMGRFVIQPQFEQADVFREGLAAVKKDGKCGYVDTNGAVKIPYQFLSGYAFNRGLAAVHTGEWMFYDSGYVDKTGKFVWRSPQQKIDLEKLAKAVPAKQVEWMDVFGYSQTNGYGLYMVMARGWLQTEHVDVQPGIEAWLKEHTNAMVRPVSDVGQIVTNNSSPHMVYVWITDGTANANVELVRQGCFLPRTQILRKDDKMFVPRDEYDRFVQDVTEAGKEAQQKKAGVWKSE